MTEHTLEVMRLCVYAHLEHLSFLNQNKHELESHIREMRESIELKAIMYTDMPGAPSSDGDKVGAVMARLEELTTEWILAMNALDREFYEMRSICSPDYPGRYAMWLHKVERYPWEYVGRIIGYSEPQVKRLGYGAIPELYDLLPEKARRKAIPDALPT